MAATSPDRSRFYTDVLSAEAWKTLAKDVGSIDFSALKDAPEPYRPPSSSERDRAVAWVLERLPRLTAGAGFDPLTDEETGVVQAELRRYFHELTTGPKIDFGLVRAAADWSGFKIGWADGDFFLTAGGAPGLILADVHDGGSIPVGDETAEKSGLAKAAFAADLLLELLGAMFGLIGVAGPVPGKGEREAVEHALKSLFRSATFREEFRKLLRAIVDGDVVQVLRFFEVLEQMGNLGEFIAHYLAGMSKLDYAITAAKFLLWIAALFVSSGAALAIKLASLALDLVGIGVKISHASEFA